jgi:dsRNA-specific ribonuclease
MGRREFLGLMKDNKTITIADAVERMITAVNIVTGDDGHRSQEAVRTFLELLKMNKKDYAKQQKFYG